MMKERELGFTGVFRIIEEDPGHYKGRLSGYRLLTSDYLSCGQNRTFPVKSAKSGQNGHSVLDVLIILAILQL
jgi:hypothetical protein